METEPGSWKEMISRSGARYGLIIEMQIAACVLHEFPLHISVNLVQALTCSHIIQSCACAARLNITTLGCTTSQVNWSIRIIMVNFSSCPWFADETHGAYCTANETQHKQQAQRKVGGSSSCRAPAFHAPLGHIER